MILQYDGKKDEKTILELIKTCDLIGDWNSSENRLIHGENASVLKTLIEKYELAGKVDLVYIDPPFATKNVFKIGDDRANTISSSFADQIAYSDTLTGAAFLEFLRERLILLKNIMSETASIYLHIDYKIGHYVKILMDEIFGINNFRNDISRIKCNPKNFRRRAYGNIKDLILFYTKSENYTWNDALDPLTDQDINRLFKKVDQDGRRYTTVPLHAPGETKNGATGQAWRDLEPPKDRHWRSSPEVLDQLDRDGLIEWSSNGVPRKKIYADQKKGKKKQDIWEYKESQNPDYPTQKNLQMLISIIKASSDPGDLVLDCFCGSGTTLIAAQKLDRRWIGIDQSAEAIKTTQARLSKIESDLFNKKVKYTNLL